MKKYVFTPLKTLFSLRLLLVTCFLLSVLLCKAQTYGNEWINFNQTYYKIKVAENGIYQITYNDLINVGFPVNSVDPRKIQLFFRGAEQSILVVGEQDARIDPADYIVFYGKRNDGQRDANLYLAADAQPHPYYNLYSDSTAYFLTWQPVSGQGKRMNSFSENNITNIPAETYHWEEKLVVFTDEYSPGRQYPENTISTLRVYLSSFDYGEGWTGTRIQRGKSTTHAIPAENRFASGPKPKVEIMLTGRNNQPHHVTLQVGSNAGTLRDLSAVEFSYIKNYLVTQTIEWADIASGQLLVKMNVNGAPDGSADNVSIAYIKLTYPQIINAQADSSKIFTLKNNPSNKSFVQVQNPPSNPLLLDITSENDPLRIGFNMIAGQAEAIVPNTTTGRRLVIGSFKRGFSINKVSFKNFTPDNVDYLIVTHASLRQPAGNYTDPVQAYADYRATAQGGNYKPLLLNIDQVINQFNYGEISLLGIRNLVKFLLENGNPEFLFLVGKALTVNYNYYRKAPGAMAVADLVPTGGYPGSDVAITAGLAGSVEGAALPTGRLNAKSANDVVSYLNKVKEQEARTIQIDAQEPTSREALWKKNLIHLSGGVTAAELNLFKRYIDIFKERAISDYLGGKVASVSKTTNNEVELVNISEEVNKGVSLITFFGHSGGELTDIDIGFVSNDQYGYHNKGKYPAIIVNGCNAGNIFSPTLTFGEDWIVTPNRGALNVMAHSDQGISGTLRRYMEHVYPVAFQDTIYMGESIGLIQHEANKRFIAGYSSTTEILLAQVQQMVLQGDPAVSLFGRNKPDYDINNDRIFISSLNGEPITAFSDSFAINLIVRNLGRTSTDSVMLQVNRTLSDGRTIRYDSVYLRPIAYHDTLTYTIRLADMSFDPGTTFGTNQFEVTLNGNAEIEELSVSNNRASIDYFIPLAGTVNILPHDFAIVHTNPVTLVAQAGDIQGITEKGVFRNYQFELDTTTNFNSLFKKQSVINALGVAQWQANLLENKDSVVYYWRTKFADPQPGELNEWIQHSFTYIENSPAGWSQSAVGQLLQNEITGLEHEGGIWKFIETSNDISVKTFGKSYPSEVNTQLLINNLQYIIDAPRLTCRTNSLNAVGFNKASLSPYLIINPGGFDISDGNSCGRRPQIINTYDEAQITGTQLRLEQLIDAIPAGDYIVLFSRGNLNYETWPASSLQKLTEIGVSNATINNLKNGEPLIILGKKGGAQGTAIEVSADPTSPLPTTEQEILLSENIKGKFTSGSVLSARVGPAQEWNYMQNLISDIVNPDNKVNLNILGESFQGVRTTLFTDVLTNSGNIDLSTVDAARFPYLRLKLSTEDETSFTPAQLKKWLITYTSVPEGILLFDAKNDLNLQKQEGEQFDTQLLFTNISETDFLDSISVVYTLFNQNQRRSETDTIRLAPLAAKDTAKFNISVSTMGKVGVNDLRVVANPQILNEQDYSNNTISLVDYFIVSKDNINPIIDVAFDGVYILDGDIISPNPFITIDLRDENKFLKKEDTVGVNIFLKRPVPNGTENSAATGEFERISFSDARLSWSPASDESPFKVSYQPGPLTDGMYTLRVQAADASGNTSGVVPFEQNFEVVNTSQITNFYPYPNPFSTSTRFVFTLTGAEIPDEIKIQIMTVSGKVVREITQNEIGAIHIGNNITDFSWNGTDEFGDKLANGVYLYRVMVKSNGQAIEKRETSADKGFEKGFGKLYILR